MARARNIKPGFFKNELLVELPIFARLLFVGLWTLADREGRIEDRPKRIKIELFPCDNDDIDAGLSTLSDAGFIARYTAGNIKVIEIVNFLKHQTPHGTEKDSELPDREGKLTTNERSSKGYVTGTKRNSNVKKDANNVNPQLKPVTTPTNNALNPDSLIPEKDIEPSALVASKLPTCPQKEILDLYAELLPELPQPRIWEGARQKNLAARWKWVLNDLKARDKPHDTADGIDFFSRMFRYVARSDFLTGKPGPWCASLDWLVESGNFAKVIAGNYDNKAAA